MNRAPGDGNDAARIHVEVTPVRDPFTLRVVGALDMDSAASFLSHTVSLLDAHQPGELVLSVEDLNFVDSSGLRSFLEIREETRRRGIPFHLLNATTATQKLLAMVGLDEALEPVDQGH